MPSEEVAPHPVTVATWPVYSDWVEPGRQIGAAVEEKVILVVRVNIEKSKSEELQGCIYLSVKLFKTFEKFKKVENMTFTKIEYFGVCILKIFDNLLLM